ncbi:MAG: VCBS repeat-containing protein, partial [bacterium]
MRKLAIITAAALGALAAFCAPAAVSAATPVKLWGKAIGGRSSFNPADGATVADVDGDGRCEVLVASTDGKCYVWGHDGRTYPGFPKKVHKAGIFFQSTPAVGDIDGDRDAEIV